MPGGDSTYFEPDTGLAALPMDNTSIVPLDPNPFFGRVAYTYGLGVDQPLSVVRMGYGDRVNEGNVDAGYRALPPFALIPLWNERGQAHNGVFEDGGIRKCEGSGSTARCVYNAWPGSWFAYVRPQFRPTFWHGTLIHDKQEHAGTHYRRNRYYDPESGKFTQEDPIGLAGGVNLYGFAGGDPVNFSDPFGLCPPEDDNTADCAAGTSGWYAHRIATGEGNRILNEVGGALASCGESISCMTSLIPGTVIGAAAGRVAQALGLAGKATGNVSVAVGSELEAQVAGKVFTGRGASLIRARHGAGDVIGSKSADKTRIFRQPQVKLPGHFSAGQNVANLVDKATGGNTHLVIKNFIWW